MLPFTSVPFWAFIDPQPDGQVAAFPQTSRTKVAARGGTGDNEANPGAPGLFGASAGFGDS